MSPRPQLYAASSVGKTQSRSRLKEGAEVKPLGDEIYQGFCGNYY